MDVMSIVKEGDENIAPYYETSVQHGDSYLGHIA
jgi:hypothetical protein